MKKRMFLLGLTIGIAIASSTTVLAGEYVKAFLFPVNLFINGEEKQLPKKINFLKYNNHTYVPLRFVAESLGAKVGYVDESNNKKSTITINFPNQETSEDSPIAQGLIYHVGLDRYFKWASKTEDYSLESFQQAFNLTDQDVHSIIRYFSSWNLPVIPPEYHVFDDVAYSIPDFLISYVGRKEFGAWAETVDRISLADFQQHFKLSDEKVRDIEYQFLQKKSPKAKGASKGYDISQFGKNHLFIEKQLRKLLQQPPKGTILEQKSSQEEWLNAVAFDKGTLIVDFNESFVKQVGPIYTMDVNELQSILNEIVFRYDKVNKVYYQVDGSYADWEFWFGFGGDGETRVK
ncbi:stalk domain-containing protein [Bacillus chungangensis]|uniref:Copper amine oxidase-like N-terminal domain-containing protein n=1 Tax=Bacillus chungangensis TaxID=587633 RepID=A0ABT9WXM7_9BACI|nr:stalk domain-containing protein [Bacillus chungangensis]MDQ0178043.1 hypothetical protein [Bacillus chungangensis]